VLVKQVHTSTIKKWFPYPFPENKKKNQGMDFKPNHSLPPSYPVKAYEPQQLKDLPTSHISSVH